MKRPFSPSRGNALQRVLLLLFAGLLLASCARESKEVQPPEIIYGQDLCNLCGMIVDDPRFASALVLENGGRRLFDDIGDMFIYHDRHPDEKILAWFVHDYGTEAWLRAEGAFYIKSPAINTPMGHGLAAFEKQEDAEALAAEKEAKFLTFEELRDGSRTMTEGE